MVFGIMSLKKFENFCLPPEGQEEVNLLVVVGVGVVVVGIISFFFH